MLLVAVLLLAALVLGGFGLFMESLKWLLILAVLLLVAALITGFLDRRRARR